jgi:hypothetical protein
VAVTLKLALVPVGVPLPVTNGPRYRVPPLVTVPKIRTSYRVPPVRPVMLWLLAVPARVLVLVVQAVSVRRLY